MPSGALAAGLAVASDPGATLAALRARGAAAFDPVRFCFIEALARRMAAQSGNVRQLLEGQLTRQLALFGARLDLAGADAGATLDRVVAQHPAAADRWRQRHADDDFKRPARLAAALGAPATASPLADLLRHIDRASAALAAGQAGQAPAPAAAPAGAGACPVPSPAPGLSVGLPVELPVELKALRFFRRNWARLSVDRQLSPSIARVPEQAGPLHSQRLVLRSLQLMREVSPDYLDRFMSYVDALMWLEQAGTAGAAAAPAGAASGAARQQRKPSRGRAN